MEGPEDYQRADTSNIVISSAVVSKLEKSQLARGVDGAFKGGDWKSCKMAMATEGWRGGGFNNSCDIICPE